MEGSVVVWVDPKIQELETKLRVLAKENEQLKRRLAQIPPWSDSEKNYLLHIHIQDPELSNAKLAEMCSEEFGRSITENAIRGALHRLRRARAVSPRRPKTTRPVVYDDGQLSLFM